MKFYYIILLTAFTLLAYQKVENKLGICNDPPKLNVAVFKGNGAGIISVIETIEALRIDSEINAVAITASEIQDGQLDNFDALIFPGGSGSRQLLNLGESGQTLVRDFIENQGKGIIGICAGAYMLSSTPNYPNLKLASSIHIDRTHYNRGRGLVEFELNENGFEIFPELRNHKLFLQYYDGPVLSQSNSIEGDYTELGKYVSDIHPDDFAPKGITPGRTFILNQNTGRGKVFLMAGHPESTPGMRWMVARMVRWVCGKELVNYDKKWVRPQINNKTIIFDKSLKKEEKKNYWLLFDEDAEEQIKAMKILYSYRSRPAVRWNIGLLRSDHPETREFAAKLLMKAEYSDAIIDLKQALIVEKNPNVKKAFIEAIEFLSLSDTILLKHLKV